MPAVIELCMQVDVLEGKDFFHSWTCGLQAVMHVSDLVKASEVSRYFPTKNPYQMCLVDFIDAT